MDVVVDSSVFTLPRMCFTMKGSQRKSKDKNKEEIDLDHHSIVEFVLLYSRTEAGRVCLKH